jgi:hypothetical protein
MTAIIRTFINPTAGTDAKRALAFHGWRPSHFGLNGFSLSAGNAAVHFARIDRRLLKGAIAMKVEEKKAYVEPKMVELGNISTITLNPGGGSGSVIFPVACTA